MDGVWQPVENDWQVDQGSSQQFASPPTEEHSQCRRYNWMPFHENDCHSPHLFVWPVVDAVVVERSDSGRYSGPMAQLHTPQKTQLYSIGFSLGGGGV